MDFGPNLAQRVRGRKLCLPNESKSQNKKKLKTILLKMGKELHGFLNMFYWKQLPVVAENDTAVCRHELRKMPLSSSCFLPLPPSCIKDPNKHCFSFNCTALHHPADIHDIDGSS